MCQPRRLDSPLYHLLHAEQVQNFNVQKPKDKPVDLKGGAFRGIGLRLLNAQGIDFSAAYFRGTDLRGLDLRQACLEGASTAHAQISGAYFPVEPSADEILMSLNFATCLRYRTR